MVLDGLVGFGLFADCVMLRIALRPHATLFRSLMVLGGDKWLLGHEANMIHGKGAIHTRHRVARVSWHRSCIQKLGAGCHINGEVVVIDGGEWLKGAGQFNLLEQIPEEMWDMLETLIKAKKSN